MHFALPMLIKLLRSRRCFTPSWVAVHLCVLICHVNLLWGAQLDFSERLNERACPSQEAFEREARDLLDGDIQQLVLDAKISGRDVIVIVQGSTIGGGLFQRWFQFKESECASAAALIVAALQVGLEESPSAERSISKQGFDGIDDNDTRWALGVFGGIGLVDSWAQFSLALKHGFRPLHMSGKLKFVPALELSLGTLLPQQVGNGRVGVVDGGLRPLLQIKYGSFVVPIGWHFSANYAYATDFGENRSRMSFGHGPVLGLSYRLSKKFSLGNELRFDLLRARYWTSPLYDTRDAPLMTFALIGRLHF